MNQNDIKKILDNVSKLEKNLSSILPKMQESFSEKDRDEFNKKLSVINSDKIISDLAKVNKDIDNLKNIM